MFVVKRNLLMLNKTAVCSNWGICRNFSSYPLSDNFQENSNKSYKSIADYYAGKSVFITGGTGFVGKVIVEKLLYSCSDINKIYMLVREKGNDDINNRITKMFDNPLFDRLKQEKPTMLNKIVPIRGDFAGLNLGINATDQAVLKDNISVVIHAGASVKFYEPLNVAMNTNFKSTQKVLELSKEMEKLEVFVYISTAYSQSTKKVLEESVYPPPAEIDEIYKFIKDYGHIEKEVTRFLSGHPFTYTFSKAMCEDFIAKNCDHVPAVIIRPSLVTAIKDGPVAGWLDNWNGVSGVLDNMAKGWSRVTWGKGHYVTDMIPVDYVANLTISSAAKFDRSKNVSVYNSCSSATNPITWAEAYALFIEESKRRGYNHIPYPFTLYSNSKLIVKWLTILFQYTPAFVADLGLKLIGKKTKYLDIQKHVVRSRNVIYICTSQEWKFKSDKVRDLYSTLSHEDKELFPFDPSHIHWKQYIPVYCFGIQKYLSCKVDNLLKES